MNIKVNLQDGTPAQFKTEIVDGSLVVTVVSEQEKEEVNLFPKWEELDRIDGYYVGNISEIKKEVYNPTIGLNKNIFTTEDLAKAALATARVSQTYRRYRELVGDGEKGILEDWLVRMTGLLKMEFKDASHWEYFYRANKEDLDLINRVKDTTQL